MPVEADLPLIYESYYTHQDQSAVARGFGRSVVHAFYQAFLWTTGLTSQRTRLRSLYLSGTRPGRLLDVGCGDGSQLARLAAMGWQVEGQEVDVAAAEQARCRHGLRVHLGALQEIRLPEATFDAVTLSHVIEHVHDPVALLKECHRILKPGGILIAVTPNGNSFLHRRFGACWRGLEPPRHLHLFAPNTLRQIAEQAGFRDCRPWTTAAHAQFLAEASWNIQRAGSHQSGARPGVGLGIRTLLLQFYALAVLRMRPDSGEECVLKAMK